MNRNGRFALLICDVFIYIFCVALAVGFRGDAAFDKVLLASGHWFMLAMLISLLYIFGAYDINHSTSSTKLMGRTALALVAEFFIILAAIYLGGKDRAGIFGRGILLGSFGLFGFFSLLLRWGVSSYFKKTLRKAKFLFVGTRELYEQVQADFKNNGFRSQAYFCLEEKQNTDHESIVGSWADLDRLISVPYQMVVVSLQKKLPLDAMHVLLKNRFESNRVRDVAQFYEEVWQKVPLNFLEPRWFLMAEGFQLMGNPIRQRLKRLMDVIVASTILILAFPIMIVAALAIVIESRGGALYSQVRTGKGGKDFVIYKFRSMVQNAEKDGAQWAQKNDARITGLGKFIRKTRIDELPQLFNILGGSMSFVGPRPERPEFVADLEKQIPFYNFRHMVQPGLTGWAQVLYPYGASIEDTKEKLQYDLYYIKNYSIWMDIAIVMKTVTVVLFGEGR